MKSEFPKTRSTGRTDVYRAKLAAFFQKEPEKVKVHIAAVPRYAEEYAWDRFSHHVWVPRNWQEQITAFGYAYYWPRRKKFAGEGETPRDYLGNSLYDNGRADRQIGWIILAAKRLSRTATFERWNLWLLNGGRGNVFQRPALKAGNCYGVGEWSWEAKEMLAEQLAQRVVEGVGP